MEMATTGNVTVSLNLTHLPTKGNHSSRSRTSIGRVTSQGISASRL